VQVPRTYNKALKTSLDNLGYPNWDKSDNPAYRLFLG